MLHGCWSYLHQTSLDALASDVLALAGVITPGAKSKG
jgi:hypothetical protein